MYNILKSLKPHFFSLREIEDNVSLDIKIPTNWEYDGLVEPNEKIPFAIKVQDKKTENSLISLISPATFDGYEYVFNYAKAVISVNKEKEEKERLFKETIDELKTLFLNTPLDKLKDISFKNGEENTPRLSDSESLGEAGVGDEQGSGSNGDN